MPKKTTRALINDILGALAEGGKSISDISKETDSSWQSVKKYLEIFKKNKIVEEGEKGKGRVFFLKTSCETGDTDNFFRLPVKKDHKKLVYDIFDVTRTEWKNTTGKELGRTQAQKVLHRVASLTGLELPMGWYLYGPVCVVSYNPLSNYGRGGSNLGKDVMDKIKESVELYSKKDSVRELELDLYRRERKQLYMSKTKIRNLLWNIDSNQERILSELPNFLSNLPEMGERFKELVNEYFALLMSVINMPGNALDEKSYIQSELFSSFDKVWRIIAMHNYCNDLLPYYRKNFSEAQLKWCILVDLETEWEEVLQKLSHLTELLPEEEEPKDEEFLRLQKIFSASNKTEETN